MLWGCCSGKYSWEILLSLPRLCWYPPLERCSAQAHPASYPLVFPWARGIFTVWGLDPRLHPPIPGAEVDDWVGSAWDTVIPTEGMAGSLWHCLQEDPCAWAPPDPAQSLCPENSVKHPPTPDLGQDLAQSLSARCLSDCVTTPACCIAWEGSTTKHEALPGVLAGRWGGVGWEKPCILLDPPRGKPENQGIQPCLLALLTGCDSRYCVLHPLTAAAP